MSEWSSFSRRHVPCCSSYLLISCLTWGKLAFYWWKLLPAAREGAGSSCQWPPRGGDTFWRYGYEDCSLASVPPRRLINHDFAGVHPSFSLYRLMPFSWRIESWAEDRWVLQSMLGSGLEMITVPCVNFPMPSIYQRGFGQTWRSPWCFWYELRKKQEN